MNKLFENKYGKVSYLSIKDNLPEQIDFSLECLYVLSYCFAKYPSYTQPMEQSCFFNYINWFEGTKYYTIEQLSYLCEQLWLAVRRIALNPAIKNLIYKLDPKKPTDSKILNKLEHFITKINKYHCLLIMNKLFLLKSLRRMSTFTGRTRQNLKNLQKPNGVEFPNKINITYLAKWFFNSFFGKEYCYMMYDTHKVTHDDETAYLVQAPEILHHAINWEESNIITGLVFNIKFVDFRNTIEVLLMQKFSYLKSANTSI